MALGNDEDITIADWELLKAEAVLMMRLERVREVGERLSATLRFVRGYAMVDKKGGIVDELERRAGEVDGVTGDLAGILSSLSGQTRAFIERVDQADDFVYGED